VQLSVYSAATKYFHFCDRPDWYPIEMPQPIPVFRNVSRLYKAKVINSVPVWHKVMQAVPPSQALPRSASSLNASVSLSFEEKSSSHYEQVLNQLLPKPHKTVNSNANKHLRRRKLRPQKISYPEDALRRKFYSDHPFELARPKTLVEVEPINQGEKQNPEKNQSSNSQAWNDLFRDVNDVTGEHVIQYQLYLIAQGKSISEAYDEACREFYCFRREQEKLEKQKKQATLEEISKSKSVTAGLHMTSMTSDQLKKLKPENYKFWLEEDQMMLKNNGLKDLREASYSGMNQTS